MTRTIPCLFLALVASGCASSAQRAASYVYSANPDPVSNEPVNITQGPMPDGESFTGSFHSQQIGDVFLEQQGDVVVGQYEYDRAACHATGRLEGRAQGNLMRFTWTESQAECGRIAPLTGRGYFLFWKDNNGNGRLNGEWGVQENEVGGGPWSAFRDRVRRTPQARRTNSSGGSVFEDANGSSGSSTPPSGTP